MVQFISATITELSSGLWTLTVNYTYYNLYNYQESYTFQSLQECKEKLLNIRCRDQLFIINLPKS